MRIAAKASIGARVRGTLLGTLFVLISPSHALGAPAIVRIDGMLSSATGLPEDSVTRDLQFKLYDAASGGTLLWTSAVYQTAVREGRFTVNLDASAGSPSLSTRLSALSASGGAYFEVAVDGGTADGAMNSSPATVRPRVRARGTAFALVSGVADTLAGVTASPAELNRLAGVTAAVQTQINTINTNVAAIPSATTRVSRTGDTMSGALGLAYTGANVNTALIMNANREIVSSSTTDAQLAYLSSTTANVQTQIDSANAAIATKAATAAVIAKVGDTMTGDLGLSGSQATASRALILDADRRIASSSVTNTELGYLSGVTTAVGGLINGLTANIQTQLDNKMTKVTPGTLGNVLTSDGTNWVSQAPAASSGASPYRQTIITSAADSAGGASLIAIGTGLAANLVASSGSPLTLAFANGMDSANGMASAFAAVTANVSSAWSGLTANATNYLFIDRDSGTGALTYAASTAAPVEGYSSTIPGNAVPVMTGVSAPSGEASGSSTYSDPTYAPWKVFNGTSATHPDAWVSVDATFPQWVKYDFGSGVTKVVSQYAVVASCYPWAGAQPQNFKLQGSNNNSTWTDLDSRTSVTGWSDCERRSYAVSSPTGYRYYRLYITANNGSTSYTAVGELELSEQGTNWFDVASNTFKSWNGSSYDTKQRLFVGTAITGASTVSSVFSAGGKSACPSDMSAIISMGRAHSYCIERTERSTLGYLAAQVVCNNAGRRLCSVNEWVRACNTGTSLSSLTGNYEWADDVTHIANAANVGSASCSDLSWASVDTATAYRCCQSMGP